MKFLYLASVLMVAVPPFSFAQKDPHFLEGRQAIVHLFEWPWEDIAIECEKILGKHMFAGVQVSPATEHIAVSGGINRPWWERYQPISYNIDSTRSGNYASFADMVRRCNNHNVRIYVDVVFNHMTGAGNHPSTGSSWYDYNAQSYPGVPYDSNSFNSDCQSDISDYNNAWEVRNCRLLGMLDLKQWDLDVKGKIVGYLNQFIDLGVAGFRVDACKHMWPDHLQAIYESLNDLNTEFFPPGSKAFIFQEVIDLGGEPITAAEYTPFARVTEFKYSAEIGKIFRGNDGASLSWLEGFGWNFMNGGDAVVFVDNHDNQRGHGAGGANVLTFRDSRLYKMATAFGLAWNYGVTRLMSSFYFCGDGSTACTDMGPPQDGFENIISPDHLDTGDELYFCDPNQWLCEHRWRQIYNMVEFKVAAGVSDVVNWWSNGNNQIAFERSGTGFIAFNNEGYDLYETFSTGLPDGTYCELATGKLEGASCTGDTITVINGQFDMYIPAAGDDGFAAIHINAMI